MQLLEILRTQFSETQDSIRAITDEVAEAGGVATDEQSANLATLNDSLEALTPRIEQAAGMANRMRGAAELLGGVPGDLDSRLDAVRRRAPATQWATIGDYARALADREVDDATREDLARVVIERERAGARGALHERAFTDTTTALVPGLLPPAWLTDIVDYIGVARPFITAFDVRPLPPTGMTVNYPSVTVRPLTGKQATEKTDIPSRSTQVAAGVANVGTYGGGEDVSVQVIQRTDPAYLSLMLELYAEEMAGGMDAAAIAAAEAVIPAPNKLPLDAATASNWSKVLANAAGIVLKAHGVLDACVVSVDAWAAMIAAVGADGRPLFPHIAPMNPVGQGDITSTNGEARGLNFVVDPWMPSNKMILGWSRAFVSLLGGMQTLSADNPSKLGRDYAVFEFAAFAPRKPTALVEITVTPAP